MYILLIEDDRQLSDAVAIQLKKEGYQVDVCENGLDADYYYEKDIYDAILLDRMLPGKDGIKILQEMRQKEKTTPVILVTALGDLDAKIVGLDAGADDYLAKPYAMEELKARLRALLRRPRQTINQQKLTVGNTALIATELKMYTDEKTTSLSKREADLLEYFFQNAGSVLERGQILARVWGTDRFVEDGNVDTYIHFVRRRLSAVESDQCIKSVHGVGYKLVEVKEK